MLNRGGKKPSSHCQNYLFQQVPVALRAGLRAVAWCTNHQPNFRSTLSSRHHKAYLFQKKNSQRHKPMHRLNWCYLAANIQIYPEGHMRSKTRKSPRCTKRHKICLERGLQCSILVLNSTPTFNRFFPGPFSSLPPRPCWNLLSRFSIILLTNREMWSKTSLAALMSGINSHELRLNKSVMTVALSFSNPQFLKSLPGYCLNCLDLFVPSCGPTMYNSVS